MATYSYTTLTPITAQTRIAAYAIAADMLVHLPYLGLNLLSLVVNADHTVTVTLDGTIRADHQGFWNLPVTPVHN